MIIIFHLQNIKDSVQNFVEVMSTTLEVDATIVDHDFYRVAGTGAYKCVLGKTASPGQLLQRIHKNGETVVMKDRLKCANCPNRDVCLELASVGYPLFLENKVVGSIWIIAFNENQRIRILQKEKSYIKLLENISNLLESKIELNVLIQNNIMKKNIVYEVVQNNLALDDDKYISSVYKQAFSDIIGESKEMQNVKSIVKKVADTNTNIMLQGETGTGKELFASAIHALSSRRHQKFIAINCASIPETLLESELFGYEKGSFTGALPSGKRGKFEMADGGTIFLDEIADMPISIQPKLLRFLQESMVEKIGGNDPVKVNVRIVAATNKDLETEVTAGRFREDLFYRLNVIPVHIPPLRERGYDIILCAKYFAQLFCEKLQKETPDFDIEVIEFFQSYNWPGNIRELKNIIEYNVNMCEGDIIKLKDFPPHYRKKMNKLTISKMDLKSRLEEYEKAIIEEHVKKFGHDLEARNEVAKLLGIGIATLYRKIDKYEIKC